MDRTEHKDVSRTEDAPPEGWKGTCILTWYDKDVVRAWLKSKGWEAYFPEPVPDGEMLAIRTETRFKRDIKDDGVAQDIFDAITVNLKLSQKKRLFDKDVLETIIEERSTPATQPQPPQQDASVLAEQVAQILSAQPLVTPLIVRLVNLDDEKVQKVVTVSTLRELRDQAAALGSTECDSIWPKLYVFQDVPGAPRGTSERVKLEHEDQFLILRAMPDSGRTVYFFSHDIGGTYRSPESPPNEYRPKAYARSTGNRSDSSSRAEFATAVRRRYREEGLEPIKCLLCGDSEQMKSFDSCHLVPFDSDPDEFLKCGLGNKTDGRNGVPMCRDCHYAFDLGLWGFDDATVIEDEDGEKIRLRVHVTEGLQQYGASWQDWHGQYRNVPNGYRWPSVDVWKKSWAHNYRRQEKKRHTDGKKRCPKCNKSYKTEKGYLGHACNPRVGAVVMPSPSRHWPPRTPGQSQRRVGVDATAIGPSPSPLLSPHTPRGQCSVGDLSTSVSPLSGDGGESQAHGHRRGRMSKKKGNFK